MNTKYLLSLVIGLLVMCGIVFLAFHKSKTLPTEQDYPEINNYWTVNSCVRSIPEPTFSKDAVKSHAFALDTTLGTGTETMTLLDGTPLTFVSSGCEYFVNTFTFSLPKNIPINLDDTGYWYNQAARNMEKVIALGDFALDIKSGIDALDTYRTKMKSTIKSYDEVLTYNDQGEENGGGMTNAVKVQKPVEDSPNTVSLSIEFSLGPL